MRIAPVLATCLLFALTLRFASAQPYNVYEDTLENAWINWSWCQTDLANQEYVLKGQSSIKATYTGAWQGLYLHGNIGFPAKYVHDLTFYINGGPVSGRTIGVAAIVNGAFRTNVDLNAYVQGHVVAAHLWRQVTIPVSAFGVGPDDVIDGLWLQEVSGGAQPSFWVDQISWTLSPAPGATLISVDAAKSSRVIDQKLFGVNTAIWNWGFNSDISKSLLSQSGFKAFRFPGGSLSDAYHWATNTSDSNTWTWATGFDDFAPVAAFAAGSTFITANYGTGTPDEAAAWVKYSNVTHRYGFKFWEIGNECFGSWEEDAHARPWDPVIYAQQFALYFKAMKAQDPTIQVGAVASAGEDAYANYGDEAVTNPRTKQQHSGWTPVMLATLANLGVKPDFIAYHRYPQWQSESDFPLLVNNGGWLTDFTDLRNQLNDYLGVAGRTVQIMCTENNNDAAGGGKQMCSLVNGLYMADSFGTILQSECNSYVWWDYLNGQDGSGDQSPWLYGWRPYGDFGVISTDFTQTYPVFYVEQLLNKFAKAGDQVVSATSSYNLLTTYAAKRSDGSVRLLVINKNPSATVNAILAFSHYSPATSGTLWTYGIDQDNAAKNGLGQQIGMTTISNVAPSTRLSFPPYSVTVLETAPKK